ncbi:hypothetical protein M5E84_12295 [[Ruminococcus] torques]|nr:hypothetical protein M5E84_12295 [[Ruminococcus] torques]
MENRLDLIKVVKKVEKKEIFKNLFSHSKKLEKGKTISEIADELEDTEENIARLIEEFYLRIN